MGGLGEVRSIGEAVNESTKEEKGEEIERVGVLRLFDEEEGEERAI